MLRLSLTILATALFASPQSGRELDLRIQLPDASLDGPVSGRIRCGEGAESAVEIDAQGRISVRGPQGATCQIRFAVKEKEFGVIVKLGTHEFETVTASAWGSTGILGRLDDTSRDFTAVADLAPSAARDSAGISLAGTVSAESSDTIEGASVAGREKAHQAGTLTAGAVDDLVHADSFANFVESTRPDGPSRLVGKRWAGVRVVDADGRGLSGIEVRVGGRRLLSRADGSAVVLDGLDAPDASDGLTATIAGVRRVSLRPGHLERVQLNARSRVGESADVLLILDTTGSMGDELSYLKTELEAIMRRVESRHPNVDIRWGLIVYRDRGDEYVARGLHFTRDFERFQGALAEQAAMGGGDAPEAVDTAFQTANQLDWRPASEAARFVLHVADAPPRANRMKDALVAVQSLRDQGTAVYPVAASGIDEDAEVFMRSAALMTGGQYVFLTDDSGYGLPHREATASCFKVDTLAVVLGTILHAELRGERPVLPPGDRGTCGEQAVVRDGGGPERSTPRRIGVSRQPPRNGLHRSLFDDDAASAYFGEPFVRTTRP